MVNAQQQSGTSSLVPSSRAFVTKTNGPAKPTVALRPRRAAHPQTSHGRRLSPPRQPAGLDYARRVYAQAIDWYKVAEKKAQYLLTANGAFAAIFFGLASGNVGNIGRFGRVAGDETWCALAVAVIAFCGAVGSAAAALLSRHRHNIATDFARLGVDRNEPATYKPEAVWYFGHIASLQFGPAVDLLRTASPQLEFATLTYNLVGLSRVVHRKHRLVNAGWLLTAATVIAMIVASLSIFLRSQL
jgi:hypothetical protein